MIFSVCFLKGGERVAEFAFLQSFHPQKWTHPVKWNFASEEEKEKEKGDKKETRLTSFKMCLFTPIVSELTLNRIKWSFNPLYLLKSCCKRSTWHLRNEKSRKSRNIHQKWWMERFEFKKTWRAGSSAGHKLAQLLLSGTRSRRRSGSALQLPCVVHTSKRVMQGPLRWVWLLMQGGWCWKSVWPSHLRYTGERRLGDSFDMLRSNSVGAEVSLCAMCCFAFKNLASLAGLLSAASFPQHLFSLE